MSFNSRPGFTIVEVLIATAIMGIMFVSIFALQSSMTRSVVWTTQRLERMMHAHNFFIEAAAATDDAEKEAVPRTKKITRPPTELLYKKTKLKSEEPFGQYAHDLYRQQVTITWNEGARKRQELLIGYMYQPKKAQKDARSSKQTPTAPTPKPPVPSGVNT